MGEKQKRAAEDLADSGTPAKKRKKKITNFSVKVFSKSLRQDDCFAVLQKFVHTSESGQEEDPAVLFLKEGGKFGDVLNVLEQNSDADFTDISTVFSAIRLLILRTLTHVQEQKPSAEDACHHLLGRHMSSIHKLLNGDSLFCQKVVLELLSALVMLSSKLASELLNHLNFDNHVIEKLTRAADASKKWSPRQSFIHFLMAFLVEGNAVPIRMLLEKKKLFTSIIPGLRFDKSDLAVFALVTMKTKLVECHEISKTLKMRTFNTQVMGALLSLYQWMGPSKNIIKADKRNRWKKGAKKIEMDTMEIEVDEGQRETVAEAAHALLLVLCSSYKYGVVFRDPSFGTGAERPNALMVSVLKDLSEPWKHKLQVELIVNMVKSCSELSQHLFSSVASYVEPRPKPSWLNIIDYVTQVVAAINIKPLFNMNPGPFGQVCRSVLVPKVLLFAVGKPGLQHSEPAVRLAAARFLNEVIQNVVDVHSMRRTWTKDADNLILHVASCCPIDILIKGAWDATLSNKTAGAVLPVPRKEQQLFALADLIALYQQSFPMLIESPMALGATLSKTLLLDSSERDIVHLQVKVVQILANLENFRLAEDKAKFPQVIKLLLQTANSTDVVMVRASQAALGALLVDSNLLELPSAGVGRELSVWLYCWYNVAVENMPLVLAFLQEVVMQAVRMRPKYIKKLLEVQENLVQKLSLMQEGTATTADKIFAELLKTSDVNTKGDTNTHTEKYEDSEELPSTLSVMLVAAVDVASQKKLDTSVEKFLSCVLVHLLHLQEHPQQFLEAVNQWDMPQEIACYLQGWGSSKDPSALKKQFGKTESSISHLLLLPGSAAPKLEDCSDPIAIILFTRLIVFHIAQLTKQGKLSSEVCDSGVAALTSLLTAAQEVDCSSDESKATVQSRTTITCLKIIFKHPVLVNFFSPLCKKKEEMKLLVTSFLVDILKGTFESLSDIYKKNLITFTLKNKLQRDILYRLEHPEKTPSRKKALHSAIQYLSLSYSERQDLVTRIVPFTFASPWTELLAHLLKTVGLLPSSVITSLGDVLARGLSEHINEGSFVESGVISSFCQYLESFPFCTEYISDELFEIAVKCNCSHLAVTLLKHNPSFTQKLVSLVLDPESVLLSNPELLFPCLDASKNRLSVEVLSKVYEHYKKQIKKAVKQSFSSPEYIHNHLEVLELLITHCMDPQKCKTYSELLSENQVDLKIFSEHDLSVVRALRLKKGWEGCGTVLAQLLIQQLVILLKSPESTSHQFVSLCTLLKDHLADQETEWGEEPLKPDSNINTLPPLLLQSVFKSDEKDVSVHLLNAFAYLVNKVNNVEFAGTVFEMSISHSQFLNILLAREEQSLKLAVLVLLYTCCKVSPKVMKTTHVPVWLGGYGATLSHSDQMLLKLLHRYESSGLSLYAYRPYLWGEKAISHYSVRSAAGMALWRIPDGSQVMELLEREVLENTILHFPYRRGMPEQDDKDPANSAKEKPLELVSLEKNRSDVYDPAFIMPLLCHVLAPEMVVKTFKFFHSGAMSLSLATLGSQNDEIRTAATSVLARYLSHLESNAPTQLSTLIVQFVEMVRYKLNSLMKQNRSRDKSQGAPRVPSMSATFLAKAAQILLESSHPLFAVLNFLLLLKPIDSIPGFMLFLRANKENYRIYQYWMLECVRDGMKSTQDILSVSRHFTLLQSLFSSSLSNSFTQSLVLQILEVTAYVQGSRETMMQRGLLSWLYLALDQVMERGNSAVAMGFLRLAVILQDSLPELLPLSLPLLKLLPRNLCRQNLCWLLKFALNTVNSFTSEQMLMLMHWCYPILGGTAVSKYVEQLGFKGDTILDVLSDENDLPPVLDENVSPKKVVADDKTLLEDLKAVVLAWLKR